MQRAGDIEDFRFLIGAAPIFRGGGGGGRYVPSLADVQIVAQEHKVADLLEAAETSFKPLFEYYEAVDAGTSAFEAQLTPGDEEPSTQLLRLNLSESKRRRGLRFQIFHDPMLRYLGTPKSDSALGDLQNAFSAQAATDAPSAPACSSGWFEEKGQIRHAAEFIAARILAKRA